MVPVPVPLISAISETLLSQHSRYAAQENTKLGSNVRAVANHLIGISQPKICRAAEDIVDA